MIAKKKGSMNRSIMMRDQFLEDGRTIGRLGREKQWLARQLAVRGIYPAQTADCGQDGVETAMLTELWMQTVEKAGL